MRKSINVTSQASRSRTGLPILARSLFRQMRDQGYSTEQIIGFSTELIDLVRSDMSSHWKPAE